MGLQRWAPNFWGFVIWLLKIRSSAQIIHLVLRLLELEVVLEVKSNCQWQKQISHIPNPFPVRDSVYLQSCLREKSVLICLLLFPTLSCLFTGDLVWTAILDVIDGTTALAVTPTVGVFMLIQQGSNFNIIINPKGFHS